MGEKADFEHLSVHDKYYLAQKSRKEDFAFAIVGGIFASLILWIFSDIMADDNPNFWLHQKFILVLGPIFLCCIVISIILSSKRVQKAKEALAGDLTSLNTPRWTEKGQGFILTKVHRDDVEIGKQIHSDFSEALVTGDVFFMFRAECTSVKSHTEHWTMPAHTPSHGGGRDGYGHGGYGGREETSGSTTYYSAELKLKSTPTVFSATEYKSWITKGEIVDLLVEVMRHRGKDRESCRVKKLKSLTPLTK